MVCTRVSYEEVGVKETSLDIGRILSRSGLHKKGLAQAQVEEPKRRPFHRKKQTSNVVKLNTGSRALTEPVMPEKADDVPGIRWNAPGFAPMTRIMTSFGAVYAQALREGDMVRTRAGSFERIKWLDRVSLDEDFMARNPDAQPVLIRAGALGRGVPAEDVLLAPGQTVSPNEVGLIRKSVRARDLLGRPNILRKAETAISYTRFHLGVDADVLCEKLWISVNPE